MITIAATDPSAVIAELPQEPPPYENSPIHYLKFIPIIGYIFCDIINTSLNEYLLQKNPPPSLERRLQIYRAQEFSFRYTNAVQSLYILAVMNLPMVFPPHVALFVAGIFCIDVLTLAIKQNMQRKKTMERFGDGVSFFT